MAGLLEVVGTYAAEEPAEINLDADRIKYGLDAVQPKRTRFEGFLHAQKNPPESRSREARSSGDPPAHDPWF